MREAISGFTSCPPPLHREAVTAHLIDRLSSPGRRGHPAARVRGERGAERPESLAIPAFDHLDAHDEIPAWLDAQAALLGCAEFNRWRTRR